MRNNDRFPGYLESDLAKQKIHKPPRNKAKEIDIFFYKTNETTEDIISKDVSSKVISPVYDKTIKFNPTTPLNFDIAKPKFENIQNTATWGSQINGIIYEDIGWDSDKYSFISFSLLQDDTIQNSDKYRIVNYEPIFDNENKFIYATIAIVKETNATIPNLKRVNWKLTNAILIDSKTKYFKFRFPASTFLFSKGLIISIKDDNGVERIPGIAINNSSELTYKLIKVRNTNPFVYDDLTFKNFKEISMNGIPGIYAWKNESPIFGQNADEFPAQQPKTSRSITLNAGSTDIDETLNGIKKYFSRGLKLNGTNSGRTITVTENVANAQEVQSFLQGGKSFDGQVLPFDNNDLTTSGEIKKLSDLDLTSEIDKKYFVLSKLMNFIKFPIQSIKENFSNGNGDKEPIAIIAYTGDKLILPTNGGTITLPGRKSEEIARYDLIRDKEALNWYLDNEDIIIEAEISQPGKSPKIELELANADFLNITTYDENHKIILNDIRLEPDFKFNNNKKKTIIQL